MNRRDFVGAAVGVATLLGAALAFSQTPAPADQGLSGATGGRGGRGGVVHTLSPGPDLGYAYDVNPLPLPAGMQFASQVAAVAMNSKGHIFVYQRAAAGKPQLLEFDQNQKFVRGFGEDIAVRAHGMRFDAQDNMWICDQNGNTVMKLNPQGQVIMTIGEKGKMGAWDEAAGNRYLFQPIDVAIAPNGDIYIAQGHGRESPAGDSRVLRVDKNGKYITQWSGNVDGPGKFSMVHSITLDQKGNVYLADREDKRIVVYDGNGKFIRTIQMANLVCAFMVTKNNELWMSNGQDGQVEKIDWDGHVLGWAGTGPGNGIGQFGESNYMAMDAKGDIYVADTVYGRVQKLIKKK